ncbi:MAG: class I SAM-dependent methyltransferase [Candidatus Aminicenantes bacterium]|nr:class I SAM-dependent methyltransferase [Candidatus Aminicenantes bacterium]
MKNRGIFRTGGVIFFTIAAVFCSLAFSSAVSQDHWRDRLMQPDRTMDAMGVRPGMVIGEAGAGEGYFTFHLARRVGPSGMIYANDIDRRALAALDRRCRDEGVLNVQSVLGEVADPLYPARELDMIVLVYAFHDFEKRAEWLAAARGYLKPGAALVIIDRDPDKWGGEFSHFLKKEDVLDILDRSDYELVRVETFLQRENIYIFRPSKTLREGASLEGPDDPLL